MKFWNHKNNLSAGVIRCGVALLCLIFTVSAETVYYALNHLILDDQTTITGIFSWSYNAGDFENGIGQFIFLEIPHSIHNQDDLVATIEPAQIEITFNGNAHDDGVDIKLVLSQPLALNNISQIDTNSAVSKYDIGGNGFNAGGFISGNIAPTNATLHMVAVGAGFSLSWEPALPNHVLQEAPNLSTNWVDSVSGGTNPVVIPITSPTRFFRLKRL